MHHLEIVPFYSQVTDVPDALVLAQVMVPPLGLGTDAPRALSCVRLWDVLGAHGSTLVGQGWGTGGLSLGVSCNFTGHGPARSAHWGALGCPLCQESPWELTP